MHAKKMRTVYFVGVLTFNTEEHQQKTNFSAIEAVKKSGFLLFLISVVCLAWLFVPHLKKIGKSALNI